MAAPKTEVGRVFTKFLGAGGAGSSTNGHVDGSSTAIDLYAAPAAGETWRIDKIIISIVDGAGFTQEKYGALTALTNGCQLLMSQAGTELDLAGGHDIKANGHYGHFCDSVQLFDLDASPTNEHLLVVMKFETPIRLVGDASDKVIFRVRDDLTGLVEQHVCIRGTYETTED